MLFPEKDPQQLILPGSLRVVSYDICNGGELWRVGGLPNEVVTSAVAGEDAIFVAAWAGGSGVRVMPGFDGLLSSDADANGRLSRAELASGPAKQHFHYLDADKDGQLAREEYQEMARMFDRSENAALAIRPCGTGDVTQSHVLWKHTRGLPYCPSPLLYRGRLFFVKNGGLATCLDAASAKIHYEEERLGALGDYYASPVAADGKICVISHSGVATILRAGDKLEILARNNLGEQVVATPAIVGNQILIRTASHIYAFGEN